MSGSPWATGADMCRIAGYWSSRTTQHDLRGAAREQRRGGPDEHTVAHGSGWGLAVNRLAIVDIDDGHQPYELDGDVKVVFNGEIYNHDALRRWLRSKGYTFTDRCDGSILPALYAECGADFADHLDGMYAIAVIDTRAEPRLVLASDDLGMKPLYYHWDATSGELHFASELPALLAFERVDATPSMHALDAYLSTKTPFGEKTVFKHILALAPATTVVLTRRGGLQVSRRAERPPQAARIDLKWSALELLALLRLEVGRLLQGDVGVAAITSGGLDSSFVTALAAEVDPGLHTFNIAYRGTWPHDERRFALAVARRVGSRHHQVELDPAAIPDLLASAVSHMGQPNADPITVSTYALFAAVRNAGFKVALSGDGADEVFAGYERIRDAVAVPMGERWISGYVDSLAAIPRALRESLYSADYRGYLAEHPSTADLLADRLAASTKPRLDAITELEVETRLPSYHLRRVDHMSMAHGVEVRPVFCQPRVVDFARSLAPHLRISGDEVKRVVYRAADGLLPASVLARPKQPFTLPIAAMLRPGEPLFTYAQEVLAPANLRTRALLAPAGVNRLLTDQSTRPSERTALALWSLLVFELWLHQLAAAQPAAVAA